MCVIERAITRIALSSNLLSHASNVACLVQGKGNNILFVVSVQTAALLDAGWIIIRNINTQYSVFRSNYEKTTFAEDQ